MRMLTRWGRVAAVAAAVLGIGIATVAAQTGKPKIALYISGNKLTPDDKNILTRKFLSPFTASGMYSVIDRSDVFSQKVDQERKKQRDGSVSDSMIYVIGHEAGAKYVCIVELDYGLGRWNIGARMVDVVTAEIYLNSGETDIEGKLDKADFSAAAKTIFNQIHGKSAGGGAQTQQSAGIGTITDSRDGKKYKTVAIGGKTWMAENLNYQTSSGSWCFDNNSSNCGKYGRLYDWNTALTVCPAGFHLPSAIEWDRLTLTIGGTRKKYENDLFKGHEHFAWADAGTKLKARSGWNDNGNGTDEFGFSALPGGYRGPDGGFYTDGYTGDWWTATERGGDASSRGMSYNRDYVRSGDDYTGNGRSVRCVANN